LRHISISRERDKDIVNSGGWALDRKGEMSTLRFRETEIGRIER